MNKNDFKIIIEDYIRLYLQESDTFSVKDFIAFLEVEEEIEEDEYVEEDDEFELDN